MASHAWWCRGGKGELDHEKLHGNLNREIDPSDVETALTTG
jgi:aerobic C4-dicarboxylate transport protein